MTTGATTAALRQVTPYAAVLLAPNPGPMTLDGTNTWVLRAPGSESCLVVDPGPLHEGHLGSVAAQGPVETILLTHGHADHSEGAARLAELTGAPVRALDPRHRLGDEGLAEGDVVARAGLELRVWATPGHTADSLSFLVDGPDAIAEGVLTGDTILGRGTTVVAHPDGVLADYLVSLRRLRELGEVTVLPGHGGELARAGEVAQFYLEHREQRLEQVRQAVAGGATTPDDVLDTVYADVDRAVWPAARLSVQAQLAYLHADAGPADEGPDDGAHP